MVIGDTGPEMEDDKERREVARDQRRAMGLEDDSNPDFKLRLEHFLKLLQFLEDVLKRNVESDPTESDSEPSSVVGGAIAQSILDATRRVFLENILYPSILECSDTDGSAVAVMSYIEVMICTLRDGRLAELLVYFLMSEDNDEFKSPAKVHTRQSSVAPPQSQSSTSVNKQTKLKRRKSSAMVLLEMEAPESNRPSEYFTSMGRFTLKDLLLSNLRSSSQGAATSALQLLNTLLERHPRLCQERLLLVLPDPFATRFPHPYPLSPLLPQPDNDDDDDDEDDDEVFTYPGANTTDVVHDSSLDVFPFSSPDTTYSTHEREINLYLTLVSRVDPSHSADAFSTSFNHYLHDALESIQAHPAFVWDVSDDVRKQLKHRMNSNDPVISLVLGTLRKFFSNTPELNMTLSGVLVSLAIHPDCSLAGWLTFATPENTSGPPVESSREVEDVGSDGDDRSIDYRIQEDLAAESNILPASRMDDKSRPIVHAIFQSLVSQLDRYRQIVNNFDQLLQQRRQGLLFSENLNDALSLGLNVDEAISPSSLLPTTPEKPKAKSKSAASSFVSFLTPRKKSKPTPPVESTPLALIT
ncbi:hypothetical protein ONZ45_g10732 [Pleurotus djamor]|nr:hypothetical protein ONZ45_g10732 [Pleurotus djamor]